MARLGERLLVACLRVVRLLTAAAAVTVVGLIVLALADSRTARAPAQQLAETQPAPAAPERAPPPPNPAPLEPLRPKGPTPFVRRLEVGAELRRLLLDIDELGHEGANLKARLERVDPFLLKADRPSYRADSLRLLELLTSPPRDLRSLTLTGATDADPMGARMRVRAWTLDDPYPGEEFARVSATLEHIVRCVGRDVEGGIDVLVTPRMGHDVFPFQARPPLPRAAGVYYISDKYCVVCSELRPDFRAEVFEHELIHAYCRRTAKSFSSSRFITEGIAEYLRLVTPRDNGFNVPVARLRDSFAELAFMLERLSRAGVNLRTVEPHRLVDLEPQAFYDLGHLGYLVAQAATAYVGGDTVHRALYVRSDAPIADAVATIHWVDFLAFVAQGGRRGRLGRAVIVEDAAPTAFRTDERRAFAEALRELGAEVPDTMPDPGLAAAEQAAVLGGEKRLGHALRLLLAEPTEVRAFLDLSEAMDRQVRLGPLSAAFTEALGGEPQGETARRLAARLVDFLGAARAGHVVALSEPPETGGGGLLHMVRPLATQGFIDVPREERRLTVLIVGSPGLAASAPDLAPIAGEKLEVLLVVDLTPDGQAIQWARAFDLRGRYVAYWNPVAEEE